MEGARDGVDDGEFTEAGHHQPDDEGTHQIGEDGTERAGLGDGEPGAEEEPGADDTAHRDHHEMPGAHRAAQTVGGRLGSGVGVGGGGRRVLRYG